MASKINGVDSRPVRVSAGTAVAKVGPGGSPPQQNSTGATPTDDVQITGAARNMAAVEQQIRDMPAVDEARVAQVRQRLDDGSYQVDPQRVADKLLRMERDLSNNKTPK